MTESQPGSSNIKHQPPASLWHSKHPLLQLEALVQTHLTAADRQSYDWDSMEFLFPLNETEYLKDLAKPQTNAEDLSAGSGDTEYLSSFFIQDTRLVRGWANIGALKVPFLSIAYWAGPESKLATAARHAKYSLNETVKLWLKVGPTSSADLICVPYNPESGLYQVELWGGPGKELTSVLDARGQAAVASGSLQFRPDLISGSPICLEQVADSEIAPWNELLQFQEPLKITLAWTDESHKVWDSRNGANYHFEFGQPIREEKVSLLNLSVSKDPGSVAKIESRTLLYPFDVLKHISLADQTMTSETESLLAHETTAAHRKRTQLDHLSIGPEQGIEIHHKCSQHETLIMLTGKILLIQGQLPSDAREPTLQARTLTAGQVAHIAPNNLRGLFNRLSTEVTLLSLVTH